MIADAETTRTAPAPAGAFAGVELWCVDLGSAAPALAQMERRVTRLSSDDIETARTITDPAAAGDWLTARAGLRLLLERAAGPEWRGRPFKRTPHGKPRLEGAPVAFSLAHVEGLALIAVADGACAIGVDLERLREVRVAPERRERIEAAGAALNPHAPLPDSGEARFLQAWVRLEAYAKADGGGVGRLLTRLGIIGDNRAAGDKIPERVAEIRSAMAGAATHDLSLGENLFAAVTLASGQGAPPVRWLPSDAGGLAALLG